MRNQTKDRTDTQHHGPEPSYALFSERAVDTVEGKGTSILQLNVEGLTNAKLTVISQLAHTNNATVVLLQETHCETTERLVLPNYTLAACILSKQHGIATFIREDQKWTCLEQSAEDSELEWTAVKVQEETIINVYKPPPTRLSTPALPAFSHPCIYAGDFNCQHTEWGYSRTNPDGICLVEWASVNNLSLLYDPKEPDSFWSGRWNTSTNPDLAFVSPTDAQQLPTRRVLEKFPRSQHRPSLITYSPLVTPTPCRPVRRWNFRKADWDKFNRLTSQGTKSLPAPDSKDLDSSYTAFCNMITNAGKQSIPRGFQRNYIPCWDDECQQLYEDHQSAATKEESDATASNLLARLDEKRQERWIETVEAIDFTHSSRKAWNTVNRLTGRATSKPDACPVSANAIASQLIENGRYPQPDREFSRQVNKDVAELWKCEREDINTTTPFTTEEMAEALKRMKAGKAPGPDKIHPEFLLHIGEEANSWLCNFMSCCMERCKIPKIWRRATVIALPKPNKPRDDPKSYRPISLLCIPFKLLERLIHGRINPIIDPQLPHEQAGFRQGRSTADQVTLLTQDIEDCFEAMEKAGAVLVDLTAAYDTVWHRGLTLKLLQILPDRRMVRFITELISNRSFILKTSDGQQSRLRRLKNGVPQGSVLAPLLFNVYIHDLPDTVSRKYGYADDLAILKTDKQWSNIEQALSWDMDTIAMYLRRWRLKLSEAKTVSTAFHLNNKEARRELDVYVNNRRLNFQATTTYLGVKLDRSLTFRQHLAGLRDKVMARSALIRRLAGTGWGASAATLRTSALALVYAPAEYCAPAWSRSKNTKLLDVSINSTLRTITGCVQATPTELLPALAGIPPADLRQQAATLALAQRALEPNHILHHVINRDQEEPRLKSRRPFAPCAKELLSSVSPTETKADWTARKWQEKWTKSPTTLHKFIQNPNERCKGFDLPRQSWVRLNRLRTGVGRFKADMWRWGLAKSPSCECGVERQTAEHIISDCPSLGLPNGVAGLIEVDADTREWLARKHPEI